MNILYVLNDGPHRLIHTGYIPILCCDTTKANIITSYVINDDPHRQSIIKYYELFHEGKRRSTQAINNTIL